MSVKGDMWLNKIKRIMRHMTCDSWHVTQNICLFCFSFVLFVSATFCSLLFVSVPFCWFPTALGSFCPFCLFLSAFIRYCPFLPVSVHFCLLKDPFGIRATTHTCWEIWCLRFAGLNKNIWTTLFKTRRGTPLFLQPLTNGSWAGLVTLFAYMAANIGIEEYLMKTILNVH